MAVVSDVLGGVDDSNSSIDGRRGGTDLGSTEETATEERTRDGERWHLGCERTDGAVDETDLIRAAALKLGRGREAPDAKAR